MEISRQNNKYYAVLDPKNIIEIKISREPKLNDVVTIGGSYYRVVTIFDCYNSTLYPGEVKYILRATTKEELIKEAYNVIKL